VEELWQVLALTGDILSSNTCQASYIDILCSQETFDLVQLRKDPPWTFVPEDKVLLSDGHGSDIVRSFCFIDNVSDEKFRNPRSVLMTNPA
jgi:hypothetical protein